MATSCIHIFSCGARDDTYKVNLKHGFLPKVIGFSYGRPGDGKPPSLSAQWPISRTSSTKLPPCEYQAPGTPDARLLLVCISRSGDKPARSRLFVTSSTPASYRVPGRHDENMTSKKDQQDAWARAAEISDSMLGMQPYADDSMFFIMRYGDKAKVSCFTYWSILVPAFPNCASRDPSQFLIKMVASGITEEHALQRSRRVHGGHPGHDGAVEQARRGRGRRPGARA